MQFFLKLTKNSSQGIIFAIISQRRRNDNINKNCGLEGGKFTENCPKILFFFSFSGKVHDNKTFGNFATFIVRNFFVIWEAPNFLSEGSTFFTRHTCQRRSWLPAECTLHARFLPWPPTMVLRRQAVHCPRTLLVRCH